MFECELISYLYIYIYKYIGVFNFETLIYYIFTTLSVNTIFDKKTRSNPKTSRKVSGNVFNLVDRIFEIHSTYFRTKSTECRENDVIRHILF